MTGLTPVHPFRPRDTAKGVPLCAEETLVADPRAAFSPSQQVEQRLVDILRHSPLFVSQMQRQMNRGAR